MVLQKQLSLTDDSCVLCSQLLVQEKGKNWIKTWVAITKAEPLMLYLQTAGQVVQCVCGCVYLSATLMRLRSGGLYKPAADLTLTDRCLHSLICLSIFTLFISSFTFLFSVLLVYKFLLFFPIYDSFFFSFCHSWSL